MIWYAMDSEECELVYVGKISGRSKVSMEQASSNRGRVTGVPPKVNKNFEGEKNVRLQTFFSILLKLQAAL